MNYSYQTNRKKCTIALFLALFIYALILALLLLEIKFFYGVKKEIILIPAMKRKATAAPVRLYSPSRKKIKKETSKTQKIIEPLKKKKIEEAKKATEEKKVLERKKPTTKKTSKNREITKKSSPKKKRSRSKWFKNKSVSENPLNQLSQNKNILSEINNGFMNYMHNKNKERTAWKTSSSAIGNARSLEYELFIEKIVLLICQASHLMPLKLYRPIKQKHIIIVQPTFNRKGELISIKFPQPSLFEELNSYTTKLISKINLPPLPQIHKEENLTIPIRVSINGNGSYKEITFVPI